MTVASYVLAGLLAGISGIFLAFYTNSISLQSRQLLRALRHRRCRAGRMPPAGIPSSLNFAVLGAVILIGVLADQIIKQRRQGNAQPGKLVRQPSRSSLSQSAR